MIIIKMIIIIVLHITLISSIILPIPHLILIMIIIKMIIIIVLHIPHTTSP